MDSLLNLLPVIGTEKTLLIDSTNYWLNTYRYLKSNILIYYPQGGIIQPNDVIQAQQLREYFESHQCRQVIFLGSMNRTLIDTISLNDSPESPAAAIKFNLSALLRDQHRPIVSRSVSERLFIELNVISQCRLLMDYNFIWQRIDNESVSVRGMVSEKKGEQFKAVFYNGLIYNDLISLN